MSSPTQFAEMATSGTADYGEFRLRWLWRCLLAEQPQDVDAVPAELKDWLQAVSDSGTGSLRGLAVGSVPEQWRAPLMLASMPLAQDGLAWDEVVRCEGSDCTVTDDGQLILPADPAQLSAAHGVALKPLRRWIGERFGCRLQAAPRLGFLLWENQALVVSCHRLPLAGFLHGPGKGERHVIAVDPGESMTLVFR